MTTQNQNNLPRGDDEESSLVRFARLLAPFKGKLSLTLLMLVVLTGVNIIVPQLIATVFNKVFPGEPGAGWILMVVLTGLLSLYILRNLLFFLSKVSAVTVGEATSFTLRNHLFERLQQMSLQYYRHHQPGKLSSRVMNDSAIVQEFIQDDLLKFLQALLLFFGITVTLYAMNWQLALAATIVLPLHFVAFLYFRTPIKQANRSAQEHLADATGNLIEKFLGIDVVKGFTGEERESSAFRRAVELSRASQLKGKRYMVMQKVVADVLVGLGIILLIGFGAWQVIGENTGEPLLAGDFIAFFWYVRMLYPTVIDLMGGLAKLSRATASLERSYEVLDSPDVECHERAVLKPKIRGTVTFKTVCFQYIPGQSVLRNVSLTVPEGKVCAIVGPSGAGKSTLISLLPRFNKLDYGSIEVDGINVEQIDLRHLRENIGVVFQECFLFRATILENLKYAKPGASAEEICEMARRTGAHEFISKLPDGYNTIVGEGGVSLSRGQKQQVTLLRAMLKDPKILILDEATASIDAATESHILPAILDFQRSKTTLLITHRSELLRHADYVLRLEDGQVDYFGPPHGIDLYPESFDRPLTETKEISEDITI